MRFVIFLLFTMFLVRESYCQKQDYVWLYGSEAYDIVLPDRAADTTKRRLQY